MLTKFSSSLITPQSNNTNRNFSCYSELPGMVAQWLAQRGFPTYCHGQYTSGHGFAPRQYLVQWVFHLGLFQNFLIQTKYHPPILTKNRQVFMAKKIITLLLTDLEITVFRNINLLLCVSTIFKVLECNNSDLTSYITRTFHI